MSKITLNQASGLATLLKHPNYKAHMVNFNLDNLFSVCNSLSSKQYGFILHCLDNGRWITIKKILSDMGLKNKQ